MSTALRGGTAQVLDGNRPSVMSGMSELRARTSAAHARVDAAFSAFDLGERDSYRAFLIAHARALPAFEALMASNFELPTIRPRTAALAADLAELGAPMPETLKVEGLPSSSAWGVLYVVEGSRLGGIMLSARVGERLPKAFLCAGHQAGEWRSIGQLINAEAARRSDEWIAAVVAGAEACFDYYLEAWMAER